MAASLEPWAVSFNPFYHLPQPLPVESVCVLLLIKEEKYSLSKINNQEQFPLLVEEGWTRSSDDGTEKQSYSLECKATLFPSVSRITAR